MENGAVYAVYHNKHKNKFYGEILGFLKIRKRINVVTKLSERVKTAISDILERWQAEPSLEISLWKRLWTCR